MMELIYLLLYIVFIIWGVHAVTREGMLLSFLAPRIKEEAECKILKNEVEADLLLLQENFFDDLKTISKTEEKLVLLEKYKEAEKRLSSYHEKYFHLEKVIEYKMKKIKWKILGAVAPMLSECLTCMSSFWSVLILTIYFLLPLECLFVFVPFAVAGVTEIICTIPKKLINIENTIQNLRE